MGRAEVQAQLERILMNRLFAQSPRLSTFLRFVVDGHLTDGADAKLKEYSIGVEVFERGAEFDPRIDNIVRIQAAKLRSRLVEYYASDGARDPLVISIPKGSYAPDIRPRTSADSGPEGPERHRIAVLPFVNISSDIENEYFSDGLTEELINRLACVPELQVVARTSAFSFKGRNEDLREVGAKLNVSSVLEGSVRKSGAHLRVTAQLIDVETGFHIFSKTYQREYKDVFDLQDELAIAVALEIAPQSNPERGNSDRGRSADTRTEDLNAYNAYLRGMHALGSQFTDLSQCLDHFRQALSYSPGYAAAWAGLAHGYFLVAWYYRAAEADVVPLASEAAQKALILDPASAMGMSSLASLECATNWKWQDAEAGFKGAIVRQPALAIAYVAHAFWCLLPQLRVEEAQDVIHQGLAVDPFNPLLHAIAIYIHGRARDYEAAKRQYAVAVNIGPTYAPIPACIGCAHEWMGQLEPAIAAYREACELSLNASFPLSCLGHALAMSGEESEARQILDRLLHSDAQSPADIGRVYLGLGDEAEAVRWIELAAARRSIYLLRVPGYPRFDRLLTNTRYRQVLQGMGLPLPQARMGASPTPRPKFIPRVEPS